MNKLRNQRGSILLAAFAILALLVIIMTGLIAYGSWHKARCQLVLNRVKATYLAEAGIQHALSVTTKGDASWMHADSVAVDEISGFTYKIRPWGGYLLIESRGVSGRATESLQATVGQLAPPIFASTLSLIGPPYPLVIAGNTRVTGDVQVGPGGVSRGELHGRSYEGDSLVYGSIRALQSQNVPEVRDDIISEFLDNLTAMETNCRNRTDLSLVIRGAETAAEGAIESRRTTASIVFDVSDTIPVRQPRFFFAKGPIRIEGKSRLSRLVLKSASSISVNQSAHLEDCILVSPQITVADQAVVSGQLVADSMITVVDEAFLTDMTLVYLVGHRQKDEWTGMVQIDSRRTADACLVFHENQSATRLSSKTKQTGRIQISAGGAVNGIVWTDGYLEMSGALSGSAVANLLYYYESPTLYLNWLVDGWLERAENEQSRVLPLLFGRLPQLEFKKIGPGA